MNRSNIFSLKTLTSKIGSGSTPSGGKENYKEEGISFIRSQNVLDFVFSTEGLAHIGTDQAKDLNNVEVYPNDILLNITGDSIARCCIVPEEILPARVSQHVAIIRSNANINSNYLVYYLQYLKPYLLNICRVGGTRNALTKEALENLPIYISPFQDEIANLLTSLDAKIELNQKINIELEAMAKSLYDYWFVQFDFPNAEGKPYKSSGGKMVYDEVLKREIPEEWEVKSLDFIGDIIGGSTPSRENQNYFTNDGIPWITPKDLSLNTGNKFISRGEIDVSELGRKIASLNILPRGTVLMSSRAPIGYLAIAKNEVSTNQGFKSFVPRTYFTSEYVYYTIKNILPVIENNASGSTFKEVSAAVLKTIFIAVPKKQLINSLTSKLAVLFRKQELLEQENQELTQLRDWLLPMLMNGQVKVNATHTSVEPALNMAAEPSHYYHRSSGLVIPENKKAFARQVLAGKIVSTFQQDPHFTHIKFQKIQFLAEHLVEADLDLNYYYQAAGPYDNRFMHSIFDKFQKSKWFVEQGRRYVPLEKQEQIERYYQGFFGPVLDRLERLFASLANLSEAESEIVATLYAIWNNRLILQQVFSEDLLIEDFFKWSERKQRYDLAEVQQGLQFLHQHKMIPIGFGRELKKAKDKR